MYRDSTETMGAGGARAYAPATELEPVVAPPQPERQGDTERFVIHEDEFCYAWHQKAESSPTGKPRWCFGGHYEKQLAARRQEQPAWFQEPAWFATGSDEVDRRNLVMNAAWFATTWLFRPLGIAWAKHIFGKHGVELVFVESCA